MRRDTSPCEICSDDIDFVCNPLGLIHCGPVALNKEAVKPSMEAKHMVVVST